MKALRLFLAMSLATFLTGCITRNIDGFVPPISAAKISYTRTGKFSSTTVAIEGLTRDATTVRAEKLSIRHSNAWIPNIEITAEGYERPLTPADTK